MKTVAEISDLLRFHMQEQAISNKDLAQQTGVTTQTLWNVLRGNNDFKVSTLLAIADRLGLELNLQPKPGAVQPDAPEGEPFQVQSKVQATLARLGEVKLP